MYLKTNQFHVAQFAYLAKRMKEIDEGGTSLLDNSILMCASSLFDGDAHSADQLPILTHRQGRRHDQGRPHPRLLERATRTGRRAACTCRSWIAWAWNCRVLETQINACRISGRTLPDYVGRRAIVFRRSALSDRS